MLGEEEEGRRGAHGKMEKWSSEGRKEEAEEGIKGRGRPQMEGWGHRGVGWCLGGGGLAGTLLQTLVPGLDLQ